MSTTAPNPGDIFSAFTAFHRSGALKAAVDLGVFGAIGGGAQTFEAIAERCGAAPRGMRILVDYLVVNGFLSKEGAGPGARYSLTQDVAIFLDPTSPAYMGNAVDFLMAPTMLEAFADVAGAVRRGGAVDRGEVLAPDHEIWVRFARAMAGPAVFVARLLAIVLDAPAGKPWKVLDVAAGHGMFGVTLAGENPNARVVAVDWNNVLEVARENARKAGVEARFSTIPGSAFEVDLGSGYDIVLVPNFLHHFDPPACEAFLRKVHAALAPGGRAVTVDFMPDDNRVTPAIPAAFALVMLVATPSGDAYTAAELQRMAANAGFARSEVRDLRPSFHHAMISYKG
ncbi:MAG TPA: class I SAM-dependent methyltransferase [Candidatus Binatia bacterium]|jgi:2-polyprenyl-3-methyl-5-hydroxy-6-metoxy-1,4-benzoquinol methylase